MPWYFPWSDAIKLRACRYLLQRYLGQFLQHKIDLNQLSVDLYSGKGVVKDVLLDVELINDTFEAANLPFEIVDGFIGKVSVEIPWSALLSESTHVEIQGLEVTLKPKQVAEKSVMLSSMWGSMTKSSMQLAEECLKEEERTKRSQPSQFEGLEKFAQAIDIVLTRIKVDFTDIIIRLEQVRDDSKTRAVALEVRIKKLRYFDEAAAETGLDDEQGTYHPLPIANKCFYVEGFTIYSDEYSLKPMNASTATLSPEISSSSASLHNSELFYSTTDLGTSQSVSDMKDVPLTADEGSSGMETSGLGHVRSSITNSGSNNLVQMAACHGITEIRLKVKQSNEASGPKFELDGHVGILDAVVWPKQLEILRSLFGEVFNGKRPDSKMKSELQKPMTDSDYSKIEGELQRDFDVWQHQPRGGNNIQRAMWDNMSASREDEEFYAFTPRSLTGSILPGPGLDQTSKGYSVTTANSAKFRFKSCFVTLVEEDPKSGSYTPNFQYDAIQRLSAAHFASMAAIETWDLQDYLAIRDRFAKSIPHSHIWLGGSGVVAEGVERMSISESTLTFKLAIGTMEIWEHLFNAAQEPEKATPLDSLYRLTTAPLCMELLTFPNRSAEDRFSFAPCVVMEYEAVENNSVNLMPRQQPTLPATKLKITLQSARTDLDITGIDRLQNILRAWENVGEKPGGSDDRWTPPLSSGSGPPLALSVFCTNLTLLVRFPVLDLRPMAYRTQWWARSLHKECLVVDLAGFVFKTTVDNAMSQRLDFECRNLTAALQMSPDGKPTVVLRVIRDVDTTLDEGRREEFAECPRMSIFTKKFSQNAGTHLDRYADQKEASPPGSLEALVDATEKDPSLFATLRNMVDHEEINYVIPSPPAEAATFKENVITNSQLVIEINIPNVTAFIPTKMSSKYCTTE
ncbi:Autophagy-related protein 2-like protein B [Hypsibius exemplaris]|uniref:Autophagy-related protein 2 n=1 Tax=Hypsibius exemplaris TaxID=2072580 RepID=A0A1W0WA13_HYPEX|nr:Autophagy-related protein 2-like protein B [Hypsibius exemplaris]